VHVVVRAERIGSPVRLNGMDLHRRSHLGTSVVLGAVAALSMGAALLVPSAFRPERSASPPTTSAPPTTAAAPGTPTTRPPAPVVPALADGGRPPVAVPDRGGGLSAPLADGRHLAALTGAWVAPGEVTFDVVQLLVGEAAAVAAREDGVDEGLDFYVRNQNPRLRTLPVADDVAVTRVDCGAGPCAEGAATTYDELTRAVDRAPGRAGLHWLTVEGGEVVRIDEQYLP
jgi:hypothetical protein